MKFVLRKVALRAVAVAAALVTAVPAQIPAAQAQNLPNLGDESASVLSPQMERKIGEGFYRELRRDATFLDDFEVSGYVQDLGQRLISAGPEPGLGVEFFVLKDAQINAFAMLGGYIGVNSGLIIASESESETASVLGHEIGHLTQKHIARSVAAGQRSSTVSMIASALCLLAARSNPQVASGCLAGAQAASVQSQLAYSRDFEREADRVGLDILNRGGFDVAAMPLFFERLQRSTRILESNAPSYVRSHPLTTERIADVRNRTQGAAVYRQRTDTLTFQLVRSKLRATMDDTIDGTRDAVKFFATQIEQKAYADASAAYLGLAYAQLQAKNVTGAQAAFARITNPGSHPMFDTLAARIRRAAGDGEGALALLRAAARRHINSRAIQFEMIEVAQSIGKHQDALTLLRDQVQLYRADPKVYELQARSYAAEGKRMLQHQALGEHYALLGALQPAIEQFQMARCTGEGDFYQLSIIDARIRVLWQSMLNERSEQAARQGSSGPGGGERGRPAVEQGMPTRC